MKTSLLVIIIALLAGCATRSQHDDDITWRAAHQKAEDQASIQRDRQRTERLRHYALEDELRERRQYEERDEALHDAELNSIRQPNSPLNGWRSQNQEEEGISPAISNLTWLCRRFDRNGLAAVLGWGCYNDRLTPDPDARGAAFR